MEARKVSVLGLALALSFTDSAVSAPYSFVWSLNGYQNYTSNRVEASGVGGPGSALTDSRSVPGGVISYEVEPSVPKASTSATVETFSVMFGGVELRYTLQIIGPNNVFLPVSMTALLGGSLSGDGYLIADLGLIDPSGRDGAYFGKQETWNRTVLGPSAGFNQTFTIDLMLPTNRDIEVYMGGSLLVGGNNPSSGNVFVDPYFMVASSFPDRDAYSILVSPGIGNAPAMTAVPEPVSMALLGAGLFGLAIAQRRRK